MVRGVVFRETLSPFDAGERRLLARYVAKADELRDSQFMAEPQLLNADLNAEPITYEITNASRSVVTAVVPSLRLLYAQRSGVSFARLRKLIGRHVIAGSSGADAFVEQLREYKRAIAKVMAFDPDMGIFNVDAAGDVSVVHKPTARETFEDWLYGEYLHDDEQRLERIDQWRSIGVYEHLFLLTTRALAGIYVQFGDEVVRPILDEPALAAVA